MPADENRTPFRESLDRAPLRRWCYALVLTVVAGTLGAAILNVEPLLSANDRSRWATVWSLVERGTFQIDEIDSDPQWNTIDKVRHDGHFYSSKPPLLATLYAGVYWVVRGVTGWTLSDHLNDVARLILVVTHLVPWLAALACVARIAERYVATDAARLFVVVTAAFGTLLTAFTVTLNNHTPAAISVVFAVYFALRVLEQNEPGAGDGESPATAANGRGSESGDSRGRAGRRFLNAALAGFFTGFAVTCELPAAAFGGLLFLLLLRRAPKPTLLAFVPASLVPIAALLATNYAVSDGWKPFYAYYGTEKYRYVHEGIPSYWMEPKGMDRAVDSPAVYLMHCLVGHHGIVSLTPVWLLSLAGWTFLGRRWQSPLRPLLGIGLVTTCVVLGFYMLRTENYNYGGNCSGLRWMLWVTPLLLIAMVPVVERWGDRLWFRAVALPLLGVSIFSAHVPLENPWKQPWLFTLMQRWDWLQQYRPDPPPAFSRPLTTWFATIPEPAPDGSGPWIEFEGVDVDGRGLVWRLGVEPIPGADPSVVRIIRLTRTRAGEPPIDQPFVIDMARFNAGTTPREFLRWPEGEPAAAERAAAEILLQGLPAPFPYREGVIRYLKTGVQTDAFECQRAARQIDHVPEGMSQKVRTRTDLWLCEKTGETPVPFGVVLIETRVSELGSGETISHRRLLVRDFSR